MGVAYTPDQSQVVLATIDASSAATLRSGLDAAAIAAGWTVAYTVTDGAVYDLISPQPESDPDGLQILKCKVRIQDTGAIIGGVHCIEIQFADFDETKHGFVHWLRYQADHVLKAHFTPCQLFTWMEGDTTTSFTCVMGGIPWVPPLTLSEAAGDCSTETPSDILTERAWWSVGDFGDGLHCPTFRTGYRPDPIRSWSFRWNGFFHSADLSGAEGPSGMYPPRLFPVTNTYYYYDDGAGRQILGKMCWYGSDAGGDDDNHPLYLDPLIGWSINTTDHYPYVIGQVWDALLLSTERTDAQEITYDEEQVFVNYTAPGADHQSWFSSLFLHLPGVAPTEEESNYAY